MKTLSRRIGSINRSQRCEATQAVHAKAGKGRHVIIRSVSRRRSDAMRSGKGSVEVLKDHMRVGSWGSGGKKMVHTDARM